jgi:hypothetical protein
MAPAPAAAPTLPPVVDHIQRSKIQEIASKSPFNMFNIIAIVAILVIGYLLYRKFTDKFNKGAIKIPQIIPSKVAESPIVKAVAEVIPEPGVKDE